jgi:hypothetical protein
MTHPDDAPADKSRARGKGADRRDAGTKSAGVSARRGSGRSHSRQDEAPTIHPGAVAYQTGWSSSTATPEIALSGVVYCWWMMIGGTFEILFGGNYLGAAEEGAIHVTTPVLDLLYVLTGAYMVTLGFGILRLERWVYWGGWLMSFAVGGLAVAQIVRRIEGTTITNESLFFACLSVLFALCAILVLLNPATRKSLHFTALKGSPFSPGMALCGIVLATPALAITLYHEHINKHLTTPVLVLLYLASFVLMIVMAFMALKLQRWVWWGAWAWAIVLTGLSIDVIVRQLSATNVDVEALIFSAVGVVWVASIIFFPGLGVVREAVFRERAKRALFSPRTLLGGVLLSACALTIYLLVGDLGRLPVTYSVIGMVMGVVVALLPGADPTNRLMGFITGVLLAFASFVVRGGLLPYTTLAAAIVVTVMLLIITGITELFRNRTWFVTMLLGAGTMYALVEPLFQAAPAGYLAAAGLAFVGLLLGFGVGYGISSMLPLELVPLAPAEVQAAMAGPSQTTRPRTGSDTASSKPEQAATAGASRTKRFARGTPEKSGDVDAQAEAPAGASAGSGKAVESPAQGTAQ